jgi:hypothetical protein
MEAPNPKHQIPNKFQSTKFKIPSPHSSPQWGEGKGEGGHLILEFGAYLGFGICNLGFHTIFPMFHAS